MFKQVFKRIEGMFFQPFLQFLSFIQPQVMDCRVVEISTSWVVLVYAVVFPQAHFTNTRNSCFDVEAYKAWGLVSMRMRFSLLSNSILEKGAWKYNSLYLLKNYEKLFINIVLIINKFYLDINVKLVC